MTPFLDIEELVVDFATPAGRVRAVNGVPYEVAAGVSTVEQKGLADDGRNRAVRYWKEFHLHHCLENLDVFANILRRGIFAESGCLPVPHSQLLADRQTFEI